MKTYTIYKITFPNKKYYIGQTYNINKRWREHLNEAKRNSKSKLYRAMKKYSITINDFSIIEDNILSQDLANEREIYYISKYDSYKNGYNSTLGGLSSIVPLGDSHPRVKISDSELYEIRKIRASKKFTCSEVYSMYSEKASYSGFEKLWNYESRKEIGSEFNTKELLKFYKTDRRNRSGQLHSNSRLSNEEVLKVRERYNNGEKIKEIYSDYKDLYSLSGFRKIVVGISYNIL